MKRLSAILASLLALTLVPTVASATPETGSGSRETFASISCFWDNDFEGHIGYKGWGVEYPTNRQIWVSLEVNHGDFPAFDEDHSLMTSSSGSWRTPTHYKPVNPSGYWYLAVKVHDGYTGRPLGSDTHSCRF